MNSYCDINVVIAVATVFQLKAFVLLSFLNNVLEMKGKQYLLIY